MPSTNETTTTTKIKGGGRIEHYICSRKRQKKGNKRETHYPDVRTKERRKERETGTASSFDQRE